VSIGNYMYFAPLVAAAICLALLFVLVRSQSLPPRSAQRPFAA